MLTERQKEALRHDISLCVTAGAGTGKTHVLVNRYVSLIENAGCRPSEILALTFTDKAASEMKERVEAAIFEKEGAFWEQIKEEMMWANISTFHSFCTKVLREFPIEAGIDPGYAVLTENESEEIISSAISSLFNTSPDKKTEKSLSDSLCAYGTYYLEMYLRELHRKRRYSENFFKMLDSDEKGVVESWRAALDDEKKAIASEFKNSEVLPKAAESLLMLAKSFSGDGDKGAAYLKSIHESLSLLNSDDTDDICRGLFGIATTSGGAKNMGSKKIFGDYKTLLVSSYSALKEYAATLPSELLALEIDIDKPEIKRTIEILKALGTVYTKMEEDIRRDKQIRGAIDFTDMINLTYELFRNHPDIVSRSFRGRYKFIMIDEFQDTDPVQAEITAGLLEDENQDNTQCNRLFVVGDPKQSIYLFRDADVTQFKRSGEVIRDDYNGLTVSLDINFRSTKEVLSFVNRLFGEMLKETGKPWDFGYEPISVSDGRSSDQGSIELILCPGAKTASERAVLEAEAVSRKIKMIKDSGDFYVYSKAAPDCLSERREASWGDIAVLLERRNNLRYIEYSLKKYGIPYRVHAGLGLYEKQEIFDAVSVLSFLKNPDDDISLYAALRSPWFGFSDAEIFKICGGYAERLFDKLGKSEDEKAGSAFMMLSSWLRSARKKAPSEVFLQIVRESGILAVYSGIAGGEQMTANLEKLGSIIRERDKGGFYNLDRLISDLKTSISSNENEGEAVPEDTGEDSVIIMTVHASKGLEFPIVIIPGLSDSAPSDNSSIIMDGELGAGIKIPDFDTGDDYANSPPLSIQKYRQKQKSNAEAKRLFYVAATRARDHLVMCGTEPKEIAGSREACKTRMDWLTYSLFSGSEDGIGEGIHDVKYNDLPCLIRITKSENMPAFAGADEKPKYLYLPLGILEKSPESCSLIQDKYQLTPKKTFSATEIETYIRSPQSHRKNFVENRTESPLKGGILQSVDKGRIMHEIFAGEDAASVLEKYDLKGKINPEDYTRIYRKFIKSDFMNDVTETHCELAFKTTIGGYRFSGSIDRLVKKRDGWYIIDYKTGDKKEEESYSVQMAVYKKAAADILGTDVRTYIYHTQTGEFTEIFDLTDTQSLIVKTCESISGAF